MSKRCFTLGRRQISCRRVVSLALAAGALMASAPAGAITITEIMYHPPAADEAAAGGANLEWIEIYNEDPTVANLSGYYFSRGINFVFPHDTYLEGRSYLVVCANEQAVRARYVITNTIGNFSGRLDNAGETIALNIFGGGPEVEVRYSDRGQWPQAADGTGHSLVLKGVYLDPGDNDNWTWSSTIGGTPGLPNFEESTIVETVIIRDDEVWRYLKGTAPYPAGWQNLGFSDSGWLSGQTGIGYGDGDDRTELIDMQNGYMSFAARKTFTLTQAQIDAMSDVIFQISFDDGFVAYMNGTEFARSQLGAPGTPVAFNQAATSHEASGFEPFPLPKSLLRAGDNVLAVQIHNTAIDSSDASFIPRLVSQRTISPGAQGPPIPVVINECLSRTPGEQWLELFNTSASAVDLSGFHLSDNPGALARYTLPAGSILPAGGFLTFSAAQTGLDFDAAEVAFYLTRSNLSQVVDAQLFENLGPSAPPPDHSSARYPDGGSRLFVSPAPTRGAPNQVPLETRIVINEIMYHPPAELASMEYIELYNRGASAVDIGGFSFTRGVAYTFPPGTTLPAGGFIVVASDPASLQVNHGLGGVFGPWEGTLSDRGELIRLVDRLGNLVNEVRYSDGGQWPELADGGGSSLELIDPRQDNSVASAWEASDESGKSSWQEVSFAINGYAQQAQSELQIRMFDAGEVLIDDIRLARGTTQHIANGGFESNTAGWIIEGNHIRSHRTTEDAFAGNACLKIIASGDGDTRVNRIEIETSPAMVSGNYVLTAALRWLRGANVIHFSDYRLSPAFDKVHRIPYPRNLGSPGARNSQFLPNLGPVISEVRHAPAVPAAGQAVAIRARISDADGVASAAVRYRTSSPGGAFSTAQLLDNGLNGDGAAGDGLYGGLIPAQAAGVKVVFYIEARDTLGALRTHPRNAPARTFVYQHNPPLTTAAAFKYRLIHDDAIWNELNTRRLHSNDLLDATFVFNESEVYYNVGTRYRGSPWNRPGSPRMYRLKFPADQPYRGRRAINLSRYGNAQNERAAQYSVWRNSTSSTTSPYSRCAFARVQTQAGTFTMEHVEPVNRDYFRLWFPDDADGILMKITGKLVFDDNGNMDGNLTQWASYANRGANPSSYRWNFNHRTRELEDDFAPLIALIQKMNSSALVLDNELESIMDVEQFLRVYAARCAHDDWDTIAIGNGQNAYIYYAALEGRWKLIPWDMDHSWGNTGARIYPDADGTFATIVSRPKYRRMYQGILNEMVNGLGGIPGHWNAAEMVSKFLDRNTAVVRSDGVGSADGVRAFINGRRGSLAAQVPARIPFAITTNSGRDFSVNTATTVIEGNAWVDVKTILAGDKAADLSWPTGTRWRTTVELEGGANRLLFLAFDVEGGLVGSAQINVTSTFGWASPAIAAAEPGEAMPGEDILLAGSDFHQGIRVFFGAEEAPRVLFDEAADPGTLRAEVPLLRPGPIGITVRNIDGRSSQPHAFTILELPPQFVRGDINLDGVVDLSDAVRLLGHLYGGLAVACKDAGDADNNNVLEITDALRILLHIFRGGPPPAPPYPLPGIDQDGSGSLGCEVGLDLFGS
jgi:hypothetical protein